MPVMKRPCPTEGEATESPEREAFLPHRTPSPKPEDHGLDPQQAQILCSRLHCERKDVVAETLAYILDCRVSRGVQLLKEDLTELWDSLHESHKVRDGASKSSRFIVLGANPRIPQQVTVATQHLKYVTRALCHFVKQRNPDFCFTTVSIRLNCDKPPHRDTRNGPGGSFILLLEQVEGGEVWIADALGDVYRDVHGQRIPGVNVDCSNQPLLLDARKKLHATAPWKGKRRLLLTAWTVLNVPQNRELAEELRRDYEFPCVPRPLRSPSSPSSHPFGRVCNTLHRRASCFRAVPSYRTFARARKPRTKHQDSDSAAVVLAPPFQYCLHAFRICCNQSCMLQL